MPAALSSSTAPRAGPPHRRRRGKKKKNQADRFLSKGTRKFSGCARRLTGSAEPLQCGPGLGRGRAARRASACQPRARPGPAAGRRSARTAQRGPRPPTGAGSGRVPAAAEVHEGRGRSVGPGGPRRVRGPQAPAAAEPVPTRQGRRAEAAPVGPGPGALAARWRRSPARPGAPWRRGGRLVGVAGEVPQQRRGSRGRVLPDAKAVPVVCLHGLDVEAVLIEDGGQVAAERVVREAHVLKPDVHPWGRWGTPGPASGNKLFCSHLPSRRTVGAPKYVRETQKEEALPNT